MNSYWRSFVGIIKIPFTNTSCLRRSESLYRFYFETFTFTCCFNKLSILCIRLSWNSETYNTNTVVVVRVDAWTHWWSWGRNIFRKYLYFYKKKKKSGLGVFFFWVFLPSLREHVNLSVPVAITPQCTQHTAFTGFSTKNRFFKRKS